MGEATGAIRDSSSNSSQESSFSMRGERNKGAYQLGGYHHPRHLRQEDDGCQEQRNRKVITPESEMGPESLYPVLTNCSSNMEESEKVLKDDGSLLSGKIGLSSTSGRNLRLTPLQSLTKGHYTYFTNPWPSSVLEEISSILFKGNLGWLRIVGLVFLFLFISYDLPKSNAVLLEQSKCETYGWNAFPVWKYRAKPRWVAPMRMDRQMQKEFLQLFRGGDSYNDNSKDSSEEDSSFEDVYLDIPELQRISHMCPKDAFFYSLSPKHLMATETLARMFVAQPTPPDVLKLARALLKSRYINPKVWYFALIAASQERPDMTGFKLAHPVDAMPDIFIPGNLLFHLMDRYRSALKERTGPIHNNNNSTMIMTSTRTRRHYHRGKRAANATLSSSPQESTKPLRNINTIKKVAKRKYASKKNATTKSGGGGDAKKQKPTQKVSLSVSVSMSNSSSRTGKSQKYESGSDSSSSRAFKGPGPYKIRKKDKSKSNKGKKPEVHTRSNMTEFLEEGSGSVSPSWQKLRTDSLFEDCLVVDGTIGLKNGIENKLWYFREDMMVNQHHWYWHQEYPLNATKHRPRRAELFFYMHHNLIARYNAERLSNGMPALEPFDISPGAEIRTAYDSHLADVNSGKFWTPRPHGVRFEDVLHMEDPDFERNIFVGWYNEIYGRLIRSIQVGHLLLKNPIKTLKIKNTKGIEPLANTVEASTLTVNPMFYDAMGFHNLGHQLIGLATDPHYKLRLPTGVMADTATTMRDPEFYSYHTVVDDIFDKYKKTLAPYRPKGGEYPLRWDGVEVLDVEVVSKNGGGKNHLRTFWSTKKFELAPGVDQSIHKGDLDVDVCAVHLNHEPFDFKITVTLDPCAKTKSNKGMVRIFLAPRYDAHGHRKTLTDQRRQMIHMDTFPVDLRVGKNVIFRRSYDSNALSPWSKHLSEYEHAPKNPHAADFCGCGWPTHLYIPKGSPDGMPFDVFVMITNYDHDYVEDDMDDLSIPEPCNSPYMYCGVKFRNYPDAKPMGYPFDRQPFTVPINCPKGVGSIWTLVICKILQLFLLRPVHTLEEYVSHAPNMASTVVEIQHLDHLVW